MYGGLWTDDDIIEFIKYVKKFPGGTQDHQGLKPKQNSDDVQVDVQIKKIKTRAIDNDDNVTDWSQEQQKALESALIKYPKGGTVEVQIVGKKLPVEECQLRYRQLVEIVKKKTT
ncbi:hypothetical protein PV328_007890 [Microctonus aethiopoides]|uniref:Myb-like domain-containing protein n=1 Tax=Microctonus aethiopoides TaxID=144406 RepID=A0AA39CA64_9HYME|nr:hypothetical protein PV328_007890 [Microctonus aethiopoides]